jgi:hypothetical protein
VWLEGFLLTVVLPVALWRIDVWFHPFAPCLMCKGRGTNPGSRRGAYGLCAHGPRRVRFAARKAAARHLRRV